MFRTYRLLLVGLCLLLVVTASAQDDHRLRNPTIQDYLDVVPILVETAPYAMDWRIFEYELSRFPDWYQQDYNTIQPIYRLLREHNIPISPDFWLASRLLMWLHTAGIDLHQQDMLDFDGVAVPVHALDFDGDGIIEWILDLQHDELQGVLILRRDNGGHYHVIPSPIPTGFRQDTIGVEPLTIYQVIDIGDVNGNGLPELGVLVETAQTVSSSIDSHYFVLTWLNGGLVDIGEYELAFRTNGRTTTWTWQNVDDDAVVELIQTRPMRDNWHCQWTQITTYDISDGVYRAQDIFSDFPDTPTCRLRMAEQAMETQDYRQAIIYYEQALSITGLEDTGVDYVHVRRGIAYILSGELETGIAILETLQQDGDRLSQWIDTLLTAYDRSPTTVSVCLAAYNFFIYNPYYVWYEVFLEVGHTVDDIIYGEGMYIPPPANAIVAGCDAPQQISDGLAGTTFPSLESPHNQLTSIGLPIGAEFSADLNSDGVDDWLIWIDTLFMPPILFVSDADVYRVSRPNVSDGYSLNNANRLYIVHLLDDNSHIALLNIDYSTHYRPVHAGFGQAIEVGNCPSRGYAVIWQFDGTTLNRLHSATLCERLDPVQIVDSLDSVSSLHGWAFSDSIGDYVPVDYRWDAASGQFELTAESRTALEPVMPTQSLQPAPLPLGYGGQYLRDGRYDLIFMYYQQAITQTQSEQDEMLLYWRYVAGLAYEVLNRPDDALIEYVAVYTTAPQSMWGILARLHLETDE